MPAAPDAGIAVYGLRLVRAPELETAVHGPRASGDEPTVRLVTNGSAAGWPANGTVRLRDGAPGAIDAHPDAGWLLTPSAGSGPFAVDRAAEVVACPPVGDAPTRAYLLGQVLPFVAGLRGIELLH